MRRTLYKKIKLYILFFIVTVHTQYIYAQYTMGNAGLLNTPSAEMNETGTFLFGANFIPEQMSPFGYNTGNYFAGITLFDFMELTYRETLIKTTYMSIKPKFNQQDRSLSVRIRIMREKKYLPALLIGTHDPFADLGRNYYQGYFGVMTKHLNFGENEIGVNLGYLGYTGDWNKLNNGVFAGISLRPAFYKDMTFIAEYDTKNINVGVAAKLWRHLSLHAFTNGFKSLAGGLRYECTLLH